MSTESESTESQVSPFDKARSILGEMQVCLQQQVVDDLKGGCWKTATEYLIQTYGIKDATVPDKIAECFMAALKGDGHPDETRAAVQDALAEFRSEYGRLIAG